MEDFKIEGTVLKQYTGNAAEVVVPEGVTAIDGYAFDSCVAIKKIVLPEGLKSISGNAFSGCMDMKKIIIPESVEFIGNYAFTGCTALKAICCRAFLEPKGWEPYWNLDSDAKIYFEYKGE